MSLPDEQLLYLTGIDHTVQFQSAIAQLFDEPEERQTKREAFKAHVAEMIDTLGIEILAEEFSEEGKRKPQEKETALDDQSMRARFETAVAQCNYETVLEQFSKAKGIEHRFCDPDTKEREALGIEVDPKKETESDWRKRERVWLSRIADCKGRRVLFVCGDKHYDDSAQLLEDNGFNVRRGRRYLISDAEFLDLERTSPDNAQIFKFVGLIDRRQGRWDEAIQNLERAVDRDPRNADVISELGQTYHALHRYEEALATFNRALALEPQSINFRTYPPQMALDGEANTAPLRAVVNAIEAEGPSSAAEVALDSSFQLALQERDIVAAARALASIPSEGELYKFFQFPHAWYEGLLAKLRQDAPGAHSAFTTARAETEKIVRAQPGSVASLSVLALIDAQLGDKEKAIQEGRTACDMLPSRKDAVVGVLLRTNLARIYALTGEKDRALEELDIVSKIPVGPSYGALRLDPEWDSLRGDPRFEKIVAALAPKKGSP